MYVYRAMLLVVLSTGAIQACFAAPIGGLPVATQAAAAPAASAIAPTPAQVATLSPSLDRPRSPLPGKGLVALCAVGLVAWQLRRKQATSRSGQLYMSNRPRTGTNAAGARSGAAAAAGSAVDAGTARAAR